MRPRTEAFVHALVVLALLAGVLFGSAGRTDIVGFWLYLAIFAAVSAASLVLVDPTLAQERLRPGGKRFDLRLVLVALWMLGHWTIAGLDRGRFHWSDTIPVGLQGTALVLFAGALRASVTTSESDCARAPCGDLTRGGGIPGMALGQYAGRHDRHASDSAKMGVCRLQAR
jgi:hypothetical protein